MDGKLGIANIALDAKQRLNGFKVLGVFPFYLKFIRTSTHIKLCVIRESIQAIHSGEINISDFYNSELQRKLRPLIIRYCLTGLLNDRFLSFAIRPFLSRRLKACGHFHILNLFLMIQKLDEPAFFLTYWRLIKRIDSTLLKEEKPS